MADIGITLSRPSAEPITFPIGGVAPLIPEIGRRPAVFSNGAGWVGSNGKTLILAVRQRNAR